MIPALVPESWTAWETIVVNTVSSSRVELTAWPTSPRAFISSTDRTSSWVRACSSWNRRTFSMAITAWSANVLSRAICFSVNGRTSVRRMTIAPIGTPSRSMGVASMVRLPVASCRGLDSGYSVSSSAARSWMWMGAAYRRAARDYSRPRNRHWPVHCPLMNNVSAQTSDYGILSVTKLCCILHDHVQHRLNVRRRACNHTENFTRRGLLLQRLLQFLEQAHVLDGDHRLVGKGFEKLDLSGSEGSHFKAARPQRSNDPALLTKGNAQDGT